MGVCSSDVNMSKYLGSAVLDGHLYAAGGRDESSNDLSSVEKYNPLTDEWTEVAAMKEKRAEVKLVVANEKLYAVGGHGTSDQDSVEVFDPKTNKWAIHSYLNEKRTGAGVGVIRMPLP
ncbi:kelch repeat protein [Cooperia oncophora]